MIKLVGAGPGNIRLLTVEALDQIEKASKVLAFGRIARDFEGIRKDIIKITKVDQVLDYIKEKNEKEDFLILASGDPCFYGIINILKKNNVDLDKVYPGISSLSYLSNLLQRAYSNIETITVHGRDFDFSKIEKDKNYSFLIDSVHNGNYISKKLYENNIKGRLFCGYNLSYEDEKIIEVEIGKEFFEPSSLGVVVTDFYVD